MVRHAVWSAVAIALLGSIAPIAPIRAAPLGREVALDDPAVRLSPSQRAAAHALGDAVRLVRSGEVEAARTALENVARVDALVGYADLVRVHALMREGRAEDAHRRARHAMESTDNEALRAAFGVLAGEALALAGDGAGAEAAWNAVLAGADPEDEAVRQSIQLAIVAARQRTGSLRADRDPHVLLDQDFDEIAVVAPRVPIAALTPSAALERASATLEAGRAERSIELFDRALEGALDAKQKRLARFGRARALFLSRSYPEAEAAYAALLPDVEARFWRARSLARLGRIDASLAEFTRVAESSNDEYASWALFLMGTLYDDRGERNAAVEAFRGAAGYTQFPERARAALWREGWAQFRLGAHRDARKTFRELAGRLEDPIDALRPRYWSARAAELAGERKRGRSELAVIAREYPLTYYGWRAQERTARSTIRVLGSGPVLTEGTRRVEDADIERIALLIEAGLEEHARDELRFVALRARGLHDRVRVGALLARVGDYHRANRLVVDAYADPLARGLQPGREALWWLSWPPAYRDVVDDVRSRHRGVDAELVWAIMREESRYRADARSVVGALGLLQLMPQTAAQLAEENGLESFRPEDLFDPRTNLTLGSAYLAQLGERFEGRISAAIGSYNAGARKVSSWLEGEGGRLEDDVWVEDIPYDQTRGYVKRVLRSLHVYRSLYADDDPSGDRSTR